MFLRSKIILLAWEASQLLHSFFLTQRTECIQSETMRNGNRPWEELDTGSCDQARSWLTKPEMRRRARMDWLREVGKWCWALDLDWLITCHMRDHRSETVLGKKKERGKRPGSRRRWNISIGCDTNMQVSIPSSPMSEVTLTSTERGKYTSPLSQCRTTNALFF